MASFVRNGRNPKEAPKLQGRAASVSKCIRITLILSHLLIHLTLSSWIWMCWYEHRHSAVPGAAHRVETPEHLWLGFRSATGTLTTCVLSLLLAGESQETVSRLVTLQSLMWAAVLWVSVLLIKMRCAVRVSWFSIARLRPGRWRRKPAGGDANGRVGLFSLELPPAHQFLKNPVDMRAQLHSFALWWKCFSSCNYCIFPLSASFSPCK